MKIKIKNPLRKQLKWGIAGCGRYTELTFIPTMQFLRKSSLVSIYSTSLARAKSLADKNNITFHSDNYDAFLNSGIDAVYITSSVNNHYDRVIRAARAGKHILCEKPIALNSLQAEEMVAVCKENNVQFAVNYGNRFHPLVVKAKELLENDVLGKLVSVTLHFNLNFTPNDNFRFRKELAGGGSLRDLGTHMIDLIRFLGGDVKQVCGVTDNIIYNYEVEDFAAGILKYQKSGYGMFNVSYNNKKGFNRIEILGHNGAIAIDNLIGVKNQPAKFTILLDNEAKKSFRKRGNKLLYLLRSVQESFIKNEEPKVTGYDGLINLKLMEELERKCQNGTS